MSDTGKTIALIKALAPAPEIDPEQVKQDVEDWLDDHPEATTTVQDGTITKAKLNASLQGTVDDVDELKSAFESITEESEDYTNITPISTVTGKYVFNNTYNNKLNEASDASMAYKVFPVSPGKYKIYGFGYDRYQFYMAVIGDNPEVMDGSTAISNFIRNIECGGSDYPGDFTYHTVEIILNVTGYLFVNYKNAQAEGTCGIPKIVPITDPAIKTAITNVTDSSGLHGLIKTENDYYHFTPYKDKYLFRKFKQMGGNNLFQWAGIYIGTFDENGINITTTIINYDTDIIGPITIFNTTLWPDQYGQWTGGNHTKTVNGIAYPTATQDSIKILVNGKEISQDGTYYGDVKIITNNSLYFPQSITGADLSSATKAILETREYSLDKQLNVRVCLKFVETTRCSLYYGMQAIIIPYNNILFANNEYLGSLPNATNIDFNKKEHEVIMTANDGMRLIVALKDIGLGTFDHNDGSTGYATLPAASTTRKLYYRLIDSASSQGFENGDIVMWEGTYEIDCV